MLWTTTLPWIGGGMIVVALLAMIFVPLRDFLTLREERPFDWASDMYPDLDEIDRQLDREVDVDGGRYGEHGR